MKTQRKSKEGKVRVASYIEKSLYDKIENEAKRKMTTGSRIIRLALHQAFMGSK